MACTYTFLKVAKSSTFDNTAKLSKMHGNFRIRTAGIAEVLAITQYTRESQLGLCRVLDLLELLEHKKAAVLFLSSNTRLLT